jgi:hypothetical protein
MSSHGDHAVQLRKFAIWSYTRAGGASMVVERVTVYVSPVMCRSVVTLADRDALS